MGFTLIYTTYQVCIFKGKMELFIDMGNIGAYCILIEYCDLLRWVILMHIDTVL